MAEPMTNLDKLAAVPDGGVLGAGEFKIYMDRTLVQEILVFERDRGGGKTSRFYFDIEDAEIEKEEGDER